MVGQNSPLLGSPTPAVQQPGAQSTKSNSKLRQGHVKEEKLPTSTNTCSEHCSNTRTVTHLGGTHAIQAPQDAAPNHGASASAKP
jgi:hypothetical protein